ncbi:MAG TPA: hypothetical protein DCK76_02265 [Desulfotomaculum sp.]|nr:MAG: hypothetical protein XD78_2326 [Desulfotomaculum sp. 46_296]HAG10223.1 hypothetical protein [Desulfotomaculum sp.]HBY04271.1 hypothetical protein [Desulfotomaculum sp.]
MKLFFHGIIAVLCITFLLINATNTAFAGSEEKQYLIRFKENVDREKFLTRKSLNAKVIKKFKKINLLAAKLNSNEVQDLKNDSDVLFVEADSIVKIASTGPIGDRFTKYIK